MLTLQLQLQQNAIDSYIALEINFTNTRILVTLSMGSQLAQWRTMAKASAWVQGLQVLGLQKVIFF